MDYEATVKNFCHFASLLYSLSPSLSFCLKPSLLYKHYLFSSPLTSSILSRFCFSLSLFFYAPLLLSLSSSPLLSPSLLSCPHFPLLMSPLSLSPFLSLSLPSPFLNSLSLFSTFLSLYTLFSLSLSVHLLFSPLSLSLFHFPLFPLPISFLVERR